MFILVVFLILVIIGISIWGIVHASLTTASEISAGMLILYIFLFGGIIAAIIYLIKVVFNGEVNQKAQPKVIFVREVSTFEEKSNDKPTLEDSIEKIDLLLKERKISEEEHKVLKDSYIKKYLNH